AAPRNDTSAVLVVVNGQRITESNLQHSFQTRRVPAEMQSEVRNRFIEELIDARLIGDFLAQRKIAADKKEVDEQVARIKELARDRGSDPDRVMAELGYDDEALRAEFALPLSWKRYVDKTITTAKLKKYFETHHQEFDGTRVRAKHVLIKVAEGD